jgi:signal transduction histidine kinase
VAILDLIGSSATFRALIENGDILAPVDSVLFIQGETEEQSERLGGCHTLHIGVRVSRALNLVHRAIDEARAAMRGLRSASPASSSLEQAFSNFLTEATTGQGRRLRMFIQGKPWTLSPSIQDQLFLIGREAITNALCHSEATEIEVEVQYRRDLLLLFVRDNGCGINPDAVQEKRDSHWGLRGMRDRAENIGARFETRSRSAGGTEVRLSLRLTSRAIDRGL